MGEVNNPAQVRGLSLRVIELPTPLIGQDAAVDCAAPLGKQRLRLLRALPFAASPRERFARIPRPSPHPMFTRASHRVLMRSDQSRYLSAFGGEVAESIRPQFPHLKQWVSLGWI